MLALSKMKSLKYIGMMMIFLSAVKSDSEDICTIKPFEHRSESNAISSNGIELQFVASYGQSVKSRQGWKWVHQCTASVLTKTTLLTAAHCVREFDKQKNSVVVGAKDLNSDIPSNYRQEMNISRVVPHPDYDDVTAYFDIAIIHTDEDIEFNDEFGVKPACLSNLTSKTTDFLHNENRENYLAAWDRKNETEPSVLSLSWLNLFSEKNCNTKYDVYGSSPIAKKRKKFLPDHFNSTVICAGSTVSDDGGSCKGDSGAPLVEIINKDEQTKVLIRGVVHGCLQKCCTKEYPTVFANMADRKIWNFVRKEAINPTTIYVDKKSELICPKNEKKFNFKIDKFGNKICLQVSKKQAIIGGGVGAFVFVLIVGTIIFCCLEKRRKRRRKERQGEEQQPPSLIQQQIPLTHQNSPPIQQQIPLTHQNSQPFVFNINVNTPK